MNQASKSPLNLTCYCTFVFSCNSYKQPFSVCPTPPYSPLQSENLYNQPLLYNSITLQYILGPSIPPFVLSHLQRCPFVSCFFVVKVARELCLMVGYNVFEDEDEVAILIIRRESNSTDTLSHSPYIHPL